MLKSLERRAIPSVRFLCVSLLTLLLAFPPLAHGAPRSKSKVPGKTAPTGQLYTLAARAAKRSGWQSLRRYAESTKVLESRCLAYFTLGYREYEAGDYTHAAADLGRAASVRFSLADFAAVYEANAAQAAHDPEQVVQALHDFSTHYPHSALSQHALGLFAAALLELKQPERAIEVLRADSKTEQRPALELLFARGYWQEQKLVEAAKAFEQVYYGFPLAAESDVADAALAQLRTQLGASFPAPAEETEWHRVKLLSSAARYSEALKEYDALLQAHPASPLAGEWKVDRAKCLVHLKRYREAVDSLSPNMTASPDVDAERLATLIDAYARLDDPGSMVIVLDQLRNVYPQSQAYQASLLRAGTFYIGQGDWTTAAGCYQKLVDAAPTTDLGRDAHWRVAWAYYLAADDDKARGAFMDHLKRYPDSPHAPAALYWLGRLAEKQGTPSDARALYQLLEKRFVDGYYPVQASLRLHLKSLDGPSAIRTARASASSAGEPARIDVTELSQSLPPRPTQERPRHDLCAPAKPAPALSPVFTLTALDLDDLAARYLRALASGDPNSTEALVTLARLEAHEEQYSEALFDAKKLVPDYFEYQFPELPSETWQWLYPRGFWSLVQRQARVNRLDPYLVMALIRQESAFNPKATSVADARGLMQVLPKTATVGVTGRRRSAVTQRLYSPSYNISLGCRYLREILHGFNGNVEETLAAYNAGDFRVNAWLKQHSFREPAEFVESIPFRETRLYVEAVLRDAMVYRQLIAGAPKFMRCNRKAEK